MVTNSYPKQKSVPVIDLARADTSETPELFKALQHTPLFHVTDKDGNEFTARREKRGKTHYWYAYVRFGGKLLKSYIGKPDQLTKQALIDATQDLTNKANLMMLTGEYAPKRSPKPEKTYTGQRIKFSKESLPDAAPVVSETEKFTRRQAAEKLQITPSQFEYVRGKLDIKHKGVTYSEEGKKYKNWANYTPNMVYLYEGRDVNRIAQHIIRPDPKRKSPNF